MNKLKFSDVIAMYGEFVGNEKPGRDGLLSKNRPTQKKHRHVVNPVWRSGVTSTTPAEYRRRHLGRAK